MTTATDLFYSQGYRATGINEVIQKSGVAKATFYNHFPTKDDLAKAYLQAKSDEELAYVDNEIARAQGPRERFLSVMKSLGPWLLSTEFRGCVFLNMASEVPDPTNMLRKEGKKIYSAVRQRVEELSQALIDSDRNKYGHLDVNKLVEEYMLTYTGAIALCVIYHDIWPFERALQVLQALIGE